MTEITGTIVNTESVLDGSAARRIEPSTNRTRVMLMHNVWDEAGAEILHIAGDRIDLGPGQFREVRRRNYDG